MREIHPADLSKTKCKQSKSLIDDFDLGLDMGLDLGLDLGSDLEKHNIPTFVAKIYAIFFRCKKA